MIEITISNNNGACRPVDIENQDTKDEKNIIVNILWTQNKLTNQQFEIRKLKEITKTFKKYYEDKDIRSPTRYDTSKNLMLKFNLKFKSEIANQ